MEGNHLLCVPVFVSLVDELRADDVAAGCGGGGELQIVLWRQVEVPEALLGVGVVLPRNLDHRQHLRM